MPWPPGAAAGRPHAGTAAADGLAQPTLFESALQTLMGRPFGWLIVADPTDLLDAETAELRNQLTVLRRYDDEQARFEADRAERRLAELDAYREAGLWNVRVLGRRGYRAGPAADRAGAGRAPRT